MVDTHLGFATHAITVLFVRHKRDRYCRCVHETRTRLLEAAIAVIADGGEQAVKIRDIAQSADVTEPSVYHFFGSRDGLISAAQAERYARDQEPILFAFAKAVRECRTKRDFTSAVKSHLEQAFVPERSDVRAMRVNVLGSSQGRPDLERVLAAEQRRINKMLAEPFREAQAKGWIPATLDPEILAVWIIGQITSRRFIEIDPDLAPSREWNRLSIQALLAVLGLQ